LAESLPGGRGYKDRSDIAAAYDGIAPDAIVVHLMHEPDLFVDLPPQAVLSLAGHTHGGQVRLPIVGRGMVPSEYGKKYAYGHIYEFDRHLIVSAGIGTSILPVRFGVPPEITIVTVKGRAG
ncbi:MAG: metallophosphoesterase, partial [Pseudomonadota bacterium]